MLTPRRLALFLLIFFSLHANAQLLHIVQQRGECTYGLQNDKGAWVVQPTYHNLYHLFFDSTGTRIVYSFDGKTYGLMDAGTGTVICAPFFSGGWQVEGGSRLFVQVFDPDDLTITGVIDLDGRIIIPLAYKRITFQKDPGYFRVYNKEGCGLLDREGRIVVAPHYTHIKEFEDGYAVVLLNSDTLERYGVIDSTGKEIIPPVYEQCKTFPACAAVLKDWKWGILNLRNEITIPFTLSKISDEQYVPAFSLTVQEEKGHWGLVGRGGQWILPPEYDAVSPYTASGTIAVKQKHQFFLVGQDGKALKGTRCDSIDLSAYLSELNVAAARKGNRWGMLSGDGRWLLPAQYEACGSYTGWNEPSCLWGVRKGHLEVYLYALGTNGEFSCIPVSPSQVFFESPKTILNGTKNLIIDGEGKILFGPTDKEIEETNVGLRLQDRNMREGLARMDGKMIIPAVYAHVGAPTDFGNADFTTEADDGFLYAQTWSGKYAAYDTSGKMIIDSVWNDLTLRDSLTGCRLARTGRKTVIPRDMMRPIEIWEHSNWSVIDAQGKVHATSANLVRPKFYGNFMLVQDSSTRQLHAFHLRTMKEITPAGYAEIIPYDAAHLFVRTGFFGRIIDTSEKTVYDSICNISQPLNGYCMAVSSRLRFELIDKQFNTVGDTSVDGATQFPFYLSAFFFPKNAPGDTVYRGANACVLPETSVRSDIRRMATNQMLISQIASVALRPAETTPGSLRDPAPPKSFIGYDSSTVWLEAYTDSTFTLATYRREGDNYNPLRFTTHDNYAFDRSGNLRALELKNLFRATALTDVRDRVIKKVNAVAPKDFVMDCSRPDALPWSNFSILPDRLVICIGSQDPGERLVTVELPYTELKAALDPKGPLGRMAK